MNKWKPRYGQDYYSIDFTYEDNVVCWVWRNDSIDTNFYLKGLCFKTREEAEQVAATMLEVVKKG